MSRSTTAEPRMLDKTGRRLVAALEGLAANFDAGTGVTPLADSDSAPGSTTVEPHLLDKTGLRLAEALEGISAGLTASHRVTSLNETDLTSGKALIEAVGVPVYVDDVTDYASYGITDTGWYIFARITAPAGETVTGTTVPQGVAGYIATAGNSYVDVAVLFEVAAVSKPVVINWSETTETFIFKATDLAVRNLDYRVTFYVYEADELATWEYARSTDAVFVGTKYYTEDNGVYTQAAVKAHDVVPADTYYTHAYVVSEDEYFQAGTIYYTNEGSVYTPAEVTAGDPLTPEGVDPAPVYYVDQYTLTTDTRFVGTRYYAETDGEYEQIAVKAGEPCSYYTRVITYPLPSTAAFVGTEYWTPDESELGYARAAVLAGTEIPAATYYTHAYQKLTAAGKFAEGVRYYKLEGTEYVLQEVTVGASYAKNVYYIDQWTEQSGAFVGTAYYLEQNGEYAQVAVRGGETIPAAYYTQNISYELTADETFAADKTYYTESGGVYTEAEVTVGEEVTANTYYEQSISYTQATGTFEDGVTYYTAPAGVYTEAEVTAGETIPDDEYCVQLISWPQAVTDEFEQGETYYTYINGEYGEANVAAGSAIPVNLVHDKVVIEGLVRNVTYRLNEIVDCPMEFILPVIEDETHGAWFEIRCRHAGAYSMTLVPQDEAVIATEHTQKETAGINMINLHYTVVDGVKIWRFMNTHSSIPTT